MTPNLELHSKLFEFMGALSVCTFCMAWWRSGSAAEDAVVADAADTVLDSLSDADLSNRIDLATGRNVREQLTIEEALELDRERTLRRFERRN